MWNRVLGHLAARRGWRLWVTAAGLGALAALALPPVHAVPVLLLAVPGLLAMVGAAPGWKRAFWIGFAWGWGHFAAGLYWITHAILTEVERFWWLVPIAVPALALPLAVFAAGPAALAWKAREGWPRVLVFAGAWVGFELLRGVVLTGFPWNLMGTVWAFGALPVQAAAWIGVHGLSLATVLVAASPMLGRRAMLGAGAALAGFAAFGAARLWPAEPPPQPVGLLIVQGNIAQELKWREDQRAAILHRYVEGTREAALAALRELPEGHRLVVIWPESAVPFLLADDPAVRSLVAGALPQGAMLLAGTVRAEFGPDGRARRVFNSLVALDAAGEVRGVADKVHLVPFGEYMPLSGLVPIRLVPGGMDFTPGTELQPIRADTLPPFGALICYEVIFPAKVVPPERPAWLVNVTNDAWFGISAGPWQHLAAARLRAVEEGLPLARAAQTGISAVFDARGRLVSRTGLGETAVLLAPLPAAREATAFAHLGLWIPGTLCGVIFALGWWRRRR
ncbi:apolipoprotein N-acyltransferase [Roseomonas alkaliterrae]|uniref:Apolipoprotein N-acyltransferase n=1 Tax=Neoroseomonas alkaliterrae TaxID=1452450 RepID=A0A840XLQ6_9PROT|nr:apolipoprotein N-acyltransferase [Neoroseomonas alkaliterrae]MBB5688856.1 apolipoprotein N-acyltransferase [Neoroseomonas alkaliterrae]MBR0676995.1 apolipoprotein N-acyltransferase [Neoroseomonas alkaliterrae]